MSGVAPASKARRRPTLACSVSLATCWGQVRGARERSAKSVAGGVVLVPPLVQPPRTALEVLTEVAHPLALPPSAHGRAPQPLFDRLSIHDSSSMKKSCGQSERCPEYVCLLASERCPERSYRNDVLIIET